MAGLHQNCGLAFNPYTYEAEVGKPCEFKPACLSTLESSRLARVILPQKKKKEEEDKEEEEEKEEGEEEEEEEGEDEEEEEERKHMFICPNLL